VGGREGSTCVTRARWCSSPELLSLSSLSGGDTATAQPGLISVLLDVQLVVGSF
jgi:hypothetical protein